MLLESSLFKEYYLQWRNMVTNALGPQTKKIVSWICNICTHIMIEKKNEWKQRNEEFFTTIFLAALLPQDWVELVPFWFFQKHHNVIHGRGSNSHHIHQS